MGLLIIFICIIGLAIFLCQKFNVSKKVVSIIGIVLLIIGIIIFLLCRFNVINKILDDRYSNMPTITKEERKNAVAVIHSSIIFGIDAMSYETYYLFDSGDNTYYYLKTNSATTVAGPQEEKVIKKDYITDRKKLERIINDMEKKITSTSAESATLTIRYKNEEIEKNELLEKMFSIND